MLVDFASEDEFENLARRLLVTALGELASGAAENGRIRNSLGLGVVRGNFLVERSQLRGRAEIERNQGARLRLARLFRQRSDGVGDLCVLSCTDEVCDPAHLPRVELLLGVVAFYANEFVEGLCLDSRMR